MLWGQTCSSRYGRGLFCDWVCVLALTLSLSACRGNYSAVSDGTSSGAQTETDADPGAGTTTGTTGGPAGGDDPAAVPFNFVALPPSAYVSKVKTLLTGQAANNNEVASVVADPAALSDLVDTWLQTPDFQDITKSFLATALQQSLATAFDYTQINMGYVPTIAMRRNLADSMALTVQELIKSGAPLTQLASTRSFMMTTAMMSFYAFEDTQGQNDFGYQFDSNVGDPKLGNNANYHFSLQAAGTAIPFASSVNPTDPNYLVFNMPKLSALQDPRTPCTPMDPFVMNKDSFRPGIYYLSEALMKLVENDSIDYFSPDSRAYVCHSKPLSAPLPSFMLLPTDYSDWHMVTIRQPQAGEQVPKYFNVPALRGKNTLVLNTPRVGFFTTPAFLAQWYTNPSNEARVTMNQTLIVAMNHAFDGTDTTKLAPTAALDSNHANDAACLQCHRNLDPMRQFFRHDYTIYFSNQANPKQISILPTFAFDGVTTNGNTIYDLADALAAHPRFALAWTQKLCTWANSAPCSETDPEFIRVSQVFAQSGYNYNTLVKTLMTSPLVTYSENTATAAATREITSIARREQLCALLDARLGLNDFCGLNTALAGQTSSTLVSAFPSGLYSRGVASTVLVTSPDLIIRTEMENLCTQASAKVVDAGANSLLSSSDVPGSVKTLVTQLMGIVGDVATPSGILSSHFANAVAAGATRKQAMQSTFVAACLSPSVVAIGL